MREGESEKENYGEGGGEMRGDSADYIWGVKLPLALFCDLSGDGAMGRLGCDPSNFCAARIFTKVAWLCSFLSH